MAIDMFWRNAVKMNVKIRKEMFSRTLPTRQLYIMYMVYWTTGQGADATPHARRFDSSDMLGAMKFMEELRTRQRAGEAVGFVALASENPHSIGHSGVAETGPDYNWKKRRR